MKFQEWVEQDHPQELEQMEHSIKEAQRVYASFSDGYLEMLNKRIDPNTQGGCATRVAQTLADADVALHDLRTHVLELRKILNGEGASNQ